MKQLAIYSVPILAVLVYIFCYPLLPSANRYQSMFSAECNCSKIRGPDVSFVALGTPYTLPLVQIKTLHLEEDSDKATILLMFRLHAVFAKNNISRQIYQTHGTRTGTVQQAVCMDMSI